MTHPVYPNDEGLAHLPVPKKKQISIFLIFLIFYLQISSKFGPEVIALKLKITNIPLPLMCPTYAHYKRERILLSNILVANLLLRRLEGREMKEH